MTIQRHYSLPNCTLVLEGFGDASASASELRPVMTMLTHAECRLTGKPVLRGGKDFFEGLIATVSLYAQEVLSGIRVPAADEGNHTVQLDRLGSDQHQLTFTPQDAEKQVIELNTVELFDLVEAIDQFIADTQTLPQWSLGLRPASKRFAPREPLSKQAVPLAAGFSSLAIAAVAFAAMPIPEIKQPNDLIFSATESIAKREETAGQKDQPKDEPTEDGQTSTQPNTAETITPATTPADETAKITDPEQLAQLRSQLEKQLQTNFDPNTPVAATVTYEVILGQDGKILDYRPSNAESTDLVNQTPLPKLRYNPVPGSAQADEPVALFQAAFTPEGMVRVSQADDRPAASSTTGDRTPDADQTATAQTSTSTTPQTTLQRDQLIELQKQLYNQIDQAWKAPNGLAFNMPLTFSVRTDETGKILDYTPYDQAAINYKVETPMPNLSQEGKLAEPPQGKFTRFKVVFNPDGRLEVNPWDGYPESALPES